MLWRYNMGVCLLWVGVPCAAGAAKPVGWERARPWCCVQRKRVAWFTNAAPTRTRTLATPGSPDLNVVALKA
jgi:hypothetical protein